MATLEPTTAPRRSFQSASKMSTSRLSSSTTLRDEDSERNDMATTMQPDKAGIKIKVNVQQPRKPREVELGYQKVLRTMITEPQEPVIAIIPSNSTTNILRKSHEPGNVKLLAWQRALGFVGMRKPPPASLVQPLPIYNLNDAGVAGLLEILMAEFGRGTHSSFLDDSFSIYLPEDERAAICFKVLKNVAVMYGDPLCAGERMSHVFEAFRSLCKKQRWHVAVVGAGPTLATYAKKKSWKSMEFAVEQVLNPVNNSVLEETSGKTITRTNRKLIASGLKLSFYSPSQGIQPQLEAELMGVYNTWREDRRKRNAPQAYSAVINPFALPGVSCYMYTRGSDGKPNSLAGLIKLGGNGGYLLEPCIQLPDAPKGVTGFLVTHAMGWMREQKVEYMTFGLEALPELGEITLMPSVISDTSRRFYRMIFDTLGLSGRKVFHESFHPEPEKGVRLWLLFPPGMPHISVYQAVLTATHISPQEVWSRSQAARSNKRKQKKVTQSKQEVATDNKPKQQKKDE